MKQANQELLSVVYGAMDGQLGAIAAGTLPPSLRLEVPADDIDTLGWLGCQPGSTKTYWSDRDLSLEMAGWGSARTITWRQAFSFDALLDSLREPLTSETPNRRYYGCIRFLPGRAHSDSSWEPFGAAYFVMPRFELFRDGDSLVFACNLAEATAAEAVLARRELASLIPDTTPSPLRQPPQDRHDHPPLEQWQAIFEQAVAAISQGELEKIVLARRSDFSFSQPLDPVALLRALEQMTPQCYHFCFQLGEHHGFLGATPELLCDRQGQQLRTEAVAGTRRRGKGTEEDEALTEELLSSAKDRREHQYVVDCLKSVLNPLCLGLNTDTISVLKLARVQHLCLHLRGTLKSGIRDADLLTALHPTPAVGGFPTQPAVNLIQELEPFERGGYAGPVGWVSADRLQFGVGIRSGLVDGQKLELYAGAGLVEGSDARQEWEEIEDKLGSFLNSLLD